MSNWSFCISLLTLKVFQNLLELQSSRIKIEMKHVYVYVFPIVPVLHDNGINKCCFLFIMFVGAGTHLSIFLAVMKVGSNKTGL